MHHRVRTGLSTRAQGAGVGAALDFVPAGFSGQWHGWVLLVSAGTGLGLALTGVFVAARRAARIRPLEALRDTGDLGRSLGRTRSLIGALLLIGSLVLAVLAPLAGPAGGQAMAMCVSICAVSALACFGPVVVPALARPLLTRAASTVALFAKSGLRDDVWRSAATAAPVVVLVGLLLVVGVLLMSMASTVSGTAEAYQAAPVLGVLHPLSHSPAGRRPYGLWGVLRVMENSPSRRRPRRECGRGIDPGGEPVRRRAGRRRAAARSPRGGGRPPR